MNSFLTREPINVNEIIKEDANFENIGASVLFIGTVRKNSNGKRTNYLEYEAYEDLANNVLDDLIDKTFRRWPVLDVKVIHRLGHLKIGEVAVLIKISSEHRDEAYAASRYLIEEIKHQVPIWKKEYFEDGTSEWGCCYHAREESSAELMHS